MNSVKAVNLTRDPEVRKVLEHGSRAVAELAAKTEATYNRVAEDGIVTQDEVDNDLIPLHREASEMVASDRVDAAKVLGAARKMLPSAESVTIGAAEFQSLVDSARSFNLADPTAGTLVLRAELAFAGKNAIRITADKRTSPYVETFVRPFGDAGGYETITDAETAAKAHSAAQKVPSVIVRFEDRWVPFELSPALYLSGDYGPTGYRPHDSAIGSVIKTNGDLVGRLAE